MDTGPEENTFVTWQSGKPVRLKDYRLQKPVPFPVVPPELSPSEWEELAIARIQDEKISYKFVESGKYTPDKAIKEIRKHSERGDYFVAVQRRAVEITFELASRPPLSHGP